MRRTGVIIALAACALVGLGAVAAPARAATCGYTEYQDGTFGPTVCPNGEPIIKVEAAYEEATPATQAA